MHQKGTEGVFLGIGVQVMMLCQQFRHALQEASLRQRGKRLARGVKIVFLQPLGVAAPCGSFTRSGKFVSTNSRKRDLGHCTAHEVQSANNQKSSGDLCGNVSVRRPQSTTSVHTQGAARRFGPQHSRRHTCVALSEWSDVVN